MNYFLQNRIANAAKIILSVGLFLVSASSLFAQALVAEYSDVNITSDNFITGVTRRTSMDIQKSTGKIVYAYSEKEADPSTYKDIWCVIYNPDMTVLVAPFRVNTVTTNDQLMPTVLMHQNDNSFFIGWMSGQNGSNTDIYVKKISLDITTATSSSVIAIADVLVNDLTAGDQQAPAMTIGYQVDELIVGFRDVGGNDGGGAASQGAFVKRLSASTLASKANQFIVHTPISGNQVMNAVEMKGNRLIVSYASNHGINGQDLYISIYGFGLASTGKVTCDKQAEFMVNNYLPGDQNNSQILINETNSQFVVTWSSSAAQDGSGFGAYAKIYNESFGVIKDEFLVNSVTDNNQLLSRVLWEESTNQLLFFFHHSQTTLGTLRYRIFDGATIPGQYNALDNDKDLVSGIDTKSYYNQYYNVVYNSYTNRLYLVYDLYDSYSTYNSKSKARVFIFKHPNLVTPAFVNNTDLDRNWRHVRSYAEDGTLKGESRQYYDSLGNPTQNQSRNIVEGKIIASTPVYDVYTRAAIQTLPAPIPGQAFTFKENFITGTSPYYAYTYNDFDKPATTGNESGELNNPKPVNESSLLGMYYSNNNTAESYVAATSFPYSRISYNDAVAEGVIRGANAGEALRMGAGHESKTIALPVLNEMDHYLKLKKMYFGASDITATTLAFKGTKTVVVDPNGKASIEFSDNEGLKIATAKADGSANTAVQAKLTASTSFYTFSASSYVTVSDVKISSSSALIEVWDFCSQSMIFSGTENDFNVLSNSYNCDFQIRSTNSFSVSYKTTNNHSVVTRYTNLASTDQVGNSVADFYLKDPATLSLQEFTNPSYTSSSTFTIKLIDLTSGQTIYSGAHSSFSNTLLPAGSGFYRIQLETIPFAYQYDSSALYMKINFGFPYSDVAYYFYDLTGKLVGSVAPKGVIQSSTALPNYSTQYTYSSTGLLLSRNDPDRGLTEYLYRKDGKLRFRQDAKQRVSGKFSYNNFDNFGRPAESGEYDPALVTVNIKIFVGHRVQETTSPSNPNSIALLLENNTSGGGLESVGRTQVSYLQYDIAAGDAPRTQRYTRRRFTASLKKNRDTDVSYTSKTWYSYDERGRLIWMDQTLSGLSNKTIDYTYTRELLTNVVLQKNVTSERFEHKYSYDAMQRPKKVETAAGTSLYQTEAQYYYYIHGALKRRELGGNVQGVDYVYTAQGWLKSINHPELTSAKDPGQDGAIGSSFSKDVFGMSFDYFNNDYIRNNSLVNSTNTSSLSLFAERFDGMIRSLQWQTRQGTIGNPAQYAYNYDSKNQLLSAVFGYHDASAKNFVADLNGKYKTTASYDANGNLLDLDTDKGALPMDDYSYSYSSSTETNRLSILTNNSVATDTRTYQYDEIGQLINEARGSGLQKKIVYDANGLVMEVRDASNVLKVSFVYNERGQRIKKITYSGGNPSFTTWYVLDLSGKVISIYDNKTGSTAQTELSIYGAGKEGTVQKNGTTLVYTYDVKDHLGNVRVTVDRQTLLIAQIDYFAFGVVNTERSTFPSYARRHEYQGEYSELDPETEWNAFELRMYDAQTGRWISPDPYRQYWSPYKGMGNNPINFIDPTGGYDGGYPGDIHESMKTPPVGATQMMDGAMMTFVGQEINAWVPMFDEVVVDGIRLNGSSELDMKSVSSFTGAPPSSDFWQTHMGRDLVGIRDYAIDTKKLRELNNALSTIATSGKVLGVVMVGSKTGAPTGVLILTLSGHLSTATDLGDILLDVSERKFILAGTKSAFFTFSLVTGGMVSKAVYGESAEAVAGAVTDMVISSFSGTVTDQIGDK